MDAMSGISSGNDAMRLSEQERAVLARRATQAKARGNLAAFLVDVAGGIDAVTADPALARSVAEEFAELLDALDLDPAPELTPGVCRRLGCGREVPVRAQMRAADHQRRGFCSLRCERMANLANVDGVS